LLYLRHLLRREARALHGRKRILRRRQPAPPSFIGRRSKLGGSRAWPAISPVPARLAGPLAAAGGLSGRQLDDLELASHARADDRARRGPALLHVGFVEFAAGDVPPILLRLGPSGDRYAPRTGQFRCHV
jgi:hypothetical protein